MFTDISNLSNSNIEDNKTLNEEQRKTIENGLFQLWNIISDENKKENILKQNLSQAYSENNYLSQCKILIELAQHHLNWKRYSAAAKLLNGAIVICQIHKQDIPNQRNLEKKLLGQLKQIEARFVEEQLKIDYRPKLPEQHGINSQHKKQLIELREIVKKRLEELPKSSNLLDENGSKKVQELSRWITQSINQLLDKIIKDCISLMQKEPPCDYALVGTGSLAREEMTPYSDLECFLLIAEDKPEYKQYFKHLSQLFELKIINLGETDLVKGQNLLPLDVLNPINKGLSLDVHKKPNDEEHKLIGTPEMLASYQLPEHYVSRPGNHLSDALINTIFITGQSRLLDAYKVRVCQIHQMLGPDNRSLALNRISEILKEDVERFEPKLGLEDEGRLFEVKEDFYRLPQSIVDALALHQGLKSSSTWDRIDDLCTKQFLLIEAGQRLKQVLSQANEWRLKTYMHYDRQKETVDILDRLNESTFTNSTNQVNHRALSNKDRKALIEAYKTLIPLHQCAKRFNQSGDNQNPFVNNLLYDYSPLTVGKIYARLCQYKEAKEAFEQELALYPNYVEYDKKTTKIEGRVNLLNNLGLVCFTLGDGKKAGEYHEKALAISTKVYGPEHPKVATSYNNLGENLSFLGYSEEAMKYHERALEIWIKIYGIEHPDVATSFTNLGAVLDALGNGKEAVEYHEKALAIWMKVYGPEYPKVATSYNNLGEACQTLGDSKKAIEYFDKALTILVKVYGSEHPKVATSYNNLGEAWASLGYYDKAKRYHENVLAIRIKFYHAGHPKIATSYNNLGLKLLELKDPNKAIEYFNKALRIWTNVYDFEHSNIATCYNNLGKGWHALKDPNKAIEYFKKALEIWSKIHGFESSNVAICYNNLGGVTLDLLGDGILARDYFKKALEIWSKIHGIEHPYVAACHGHLGVVWSALNDFNKAKEYHEKALDIWIKIYGTVHPDVAASYYNLGLIWMKLGNSKNARYYTEKALEIRIKFFGPNHPEVDVTLYNLRAISLQNDMISSDVLQPLLFSQKSILKSEIRSNKEIEENEEKELAEAIQLSLEIAQNSEVTKSKSLTKK